MTDDTARDPVRKAPRWKLHVVIRQNAVFGDVAHKSAAFDKPFRQILYD